MRILFVNPYDGGSHRAFAAGWRQHSRHDIHIIGLPARHWKWRMRHGALTLADQARALAGSFDAVVTTDMLDVPAWRGYAPATLRDLPTVIYFHENQLTYPDDHKGERDYHYAFTNLFSAAAATRVWFNSEYHRRELCVAWRKLAGRMPDYAPTGLVDQVAETSEVAYPGISITASRSTSTSTPCHLLWVARWEADKAPEPWFATLDAMAAAGVSFRVSVLGRASRHEPELFRAARNKLGDRVVHWGWLDSRADYEQALGDADIVVSTARHEFFGIAVAEAVAAGAFPLVPRRLAYPELLSGFGDERCFYEDDELTQTLTALCEEHARGALWAGDESRGRRAMERYGWQRAAADMDARIAALSA